jgi:hypothetical protein
MPEGLFTTGSTKMAHTKNWCRKDKRLAIYLRGTVKPPSRTPRSAWTTWFHAATEAATKAATSLPVAANATGAEESPR